LLPSKIISTCLCSLIWQLEDGTVDLLAKAIEEDSFEICTEGMPKPRTVDEYVQVWRNQIWEYGYSGWFEGKESYSKTKAFADHRNSDQAVKRVIYRLIDLAKPVVTHSLSICGSQCNANWILGVFLRFFMRELLPLGAEVKPQLPLFLTSWVDKNSAQCMYTMSQTRTWSVPHLKAGCWYIECGKTICPVEDEEVKIAYDKVDLRSAILVSDQVEVPEEENEVDLSLLPKKETNKILLQREWEAQEGQGQG
jgi:hypothetical protein